MNILNKLFINYALWEKQGFKILCNKINPYIKNFNETIIFKTSSKSNFIEGVFLGLGEGGGLKIKQDNKIFEYFSIDSFSFSRDVVK